MGPRHLLSSKSGPAYKSMYDVGMDNYKANRYIDSLHCCYSCNLYNWHIRYNGLILEKCLIYLHFISEEMVSLFQYYIHGYRAIFILILHIKWTTITILLITYLSVVPLLVVGVELLESRMVGAVLEGIYSYLSNLHKLI